MVLHVASLSIFELAEYALFLLLDLMHHHGELLLRNSVRLLSELKLIGVFSSIELELRLVAGDRMSESIVVLFCVSADRLYRIKYHTFCA